MIQHTDLPKKEVRRSDKILCLYCGENVDNTPAATSTHFLNCKKIATQKAANSETKSRSPLTSIN
jgi:hypothetical protein